MSNSCLGDLGRLPTEIRQQVWALMRDNPPTFPYQSIQCLRHDIAKVLDPTFEVSGDSHPVSSSPIYTEDKCPRSWPSEIRVYHQLQEFPPLLPAFFDFQSPDQDALRKFLELPLGCYRSLTVRVFPPRRTQRVRVGEGLIRS